MFSRALAVLLLTALPLASPALERIELLPPELQTYARISDTSDFWSMLKKSSFGRLWQDRQFQDFLGNPDKEMWMEMLFDGESEAETRVFSEQMKMLKGEVILAFDPDLEQPHLIANMTREDFLRSLEMDAQLSETSEEPFDIVKRTFQGVDIIRHIENGGTPKEESTWQAHVGSTLVFGYTREWVEKCIVQLKKEPVTEPAGDPVCNLHLPLSSMLRRFIDEEKEKSAGMAEPSDPELMMDALGLMGIENLKFQLELKETEMVMDGTLRATDLNKGIFTLLDLQSSALPTVGFIPGNISSIEVGRFDLLRFWQEIPTVLATAMPAAKMQFDLLLAMIQQQTGINIEQDLLANLGTEYISFSVIEEDKQVSVIAVELRDSAAFKTGLETALASPALQPQVTAGLEIEEFLDHTIYRIKNGVDGEQVAFAVMSGYLLYGQPDGIRQVIRNENSQNMADRSFEGSRLVKGIRSHVPPHAFSFGAADWKKQMVVVVSELSQPEYTSLIEQNWAGSGSALPPPDFSKLPPADHIASFFNVSYQYTEATPEGIHQRVILKY